MTKSILILGNDACRSFELQDAILRARMNVETHVRQRSDDQDWTGADLIFCAGDSPDLLLLLDFVEQRKPATRVVILDDANGNAQSALAEVHTIVEAHQPGKLFLAA
jgi:hypothetical protein